MNRFLSWIKPLFVKGNKISELKQKYGYPINAKCDYKKCKWDDVKLIEKFKSRIPEGWYGFNAVPPSWTPILVEFLNYLALRCPNYKIYQIKSKFGGLRFYVGLGEVDEETRNEVQGEINELENWLFHQDLIY